MYCGMIGINDSSRFVVYVGSPPKVYMLDKKKNQKKNRFLTEFENKRILEITSPRKSNNKK